MRLLLRLVVLGVLTIVFLLLVAVRHSHHSSLTLEQQETDEAIKLLLATDDDPQSSAGLQQAASVLSNGRSSMRPTTELTFNVAIVLVVSLLSVALLITGIIIVAVTLNPENSSNYHSYLTNHSSYDSETDSVVKTHQKHYVNYELEDSSGEYQDQCLSAIDEGDKNYHWDAEGQVWSSTTAQMRMP